MAAIEIHLFHHFVLDFTGGATAKLDTILALLQSLTAQGVIEMQELDTLKTQVEKTATVEQSAIALLNGLSAQIAALKNDPVALQTLSDSLSANTQALADAVTANTPAAPPA